MNAINDAGIVNVTMQAPFLGVTGDELLSGERMPLFATHLEFMFDVDTLNMMKAETNSYLTSAPINGTSADTVAAILHRVNRLIITF